jgi:hypothetical protein
VLPTLVLPALVLPALLVVLPMLDAELSVAELKLALLVVAAVLPVVVAAALPVVPVAAIGRCCSITSTKVGPPAPAAPDVLVPVLPVEVADSDELLLRLLLTLALPRLEAVPSSTNTTVAPLLSMPMKLPTRGVFVPEAATAPALLALLVCALAASALVAGELKLPAHPWLPSASP